MNKLKVAHALGITLLLAALGCSEETGPRSGAILVPSPTLSNVSAPPDSMFSIPADRGWPPAQIPLITFPYDTWVTLESPGSVTLNAKPPLPGASPNYVLGGPAPATGIVDHHTDGVCVLNLNVKDNYGNLPSFGNCGATVKIDTLLTRKNNPVLITRGPLPVKHYYECSTTSDICHWLNAGDQSTVRERAIPVTLNKLKSSKRTSPSSFAIHDSLTFTASKSMDSIFANSNKSAVPHVVTLWQWIGADLTRNPVQPWATNGPCRSILSLICQYAPYESGRMVFKAFYGGWEQTTSVTVQCLLSPADSILNDSTNDFQVRSAVLTLLDSAHPEVEPGSGYDSLKGRGIMHEIQAVVWQLENGGGDMLTPYEDVNATECASTPPILQLVPPPVAGATPIGRAHTHQTPKNKPIYGCRPFVSKDGDTTYFSQFPGDTANGKKPLMKTPSGYVNGGSVDDWMSALNENKPWYVIDIDGSISVLDRNSIIVPRIYYWDGINAPKCAWIR